LLAWTLARAWPPFFLQGAWTSLDLSARTISSRSVLPHPQRPGFLASPNVPTFLLGFRRCFSQRIVRLVLTSLSLVADDQYCLTLSNDGLVLPLPFLGNLGPFRVRILRQSPIASFCATFSPATSPPPCGQARFLVLSVVVSLRIFCSVSWSSRIPIWTVVLRQISAMALRSWTFEPSIFLFPLF